MLNICRTGAALLQQGMSSINPSFLTIGFNIQHPDVPKNAPEQEEKPLTDEASA
jgi:hypothetical protein